MRRFVQASFFSVCLLISSFAIGQTYNDGPMELKIKVTQVRVDYHPTGSQSNDFSLSGSIGGAIGSIIPAFNVPSLANDEITVKVWARDNMTSGWLGGECFLGDVPMSTGGPETYSTTPGPGNPEIFTTNYAAPTVPGLFDLRVEGWEDEKPGDFDQLPSSLLGLVTNNCQTADGFSRCNYDGSGTDCFSFSFIGGFFSEADDLHCDANPYQTGLDYRAAGPPCQWNTHGFVSGLPGICPSTNHYQVEVQSYYRFTTGISCVSPINLGTLTLGSGTPLEHINSNECYTNTLPGGQLGNDVFYKFHIDVPIGVDISLCNSTTAFDSYVFLLDNNCAIIDQNNDGTTIGCGNRSLIQRSLCTPGDYYVVVDAATAAATGAFKLRIAENTDFTFAASIVKTDPKCFGSSDGKAEVNVTGGQVPLNYAWSTGPNGPTDTMLTGLAANTYTVTVTDFGGCQIVSTTTLVNPPSMTVTTSATDLTCSGANDGTVTASVTGGTSPYFYAWNTSPPQTSITAVNLPAGTYNVTVSDFNSCINSTGPAATVTANNPIVINETITHITCFGANDGTVAVNVTGGVAPYTYSWSGSGGTGPTASSLPPGPVTITVFDNTNGGGQCFETETYTIIEPTLLVSQVNDTRDVSCNGGSDGAVDLGVTGGTPPYTYAWSGGPVSEDLLNASGGPFSVTVTDDNGCQTPTSGTLNEPSAIVTSIAPTAAGCSGSDSGGADLTVSGGAGGYTFFWSNFSNSEDLSNLPSGKYMVFVTDGNGCPHIDSVTITGFDEMTVQSTVSSPCVDRTDGKISVTASGAAPFTFSWSTGETDPEVTNVGAGSRTVTITDANGCTQDLTFNVEATTNCSGGILDVAIPNIFSPNGDDRNDFFDIYAADDVSKIQVKIYDRWGSKIYENPNQMPNSEGKGWDGRVRGDEAQIGAYVYVMEIEYSTPAKDRPTQKTGTVTVVR